MGIIFPFQVFLMHVKNAQDGSFDLDWLRYISREKAKYGFAHRTYPAYCFITLFNSSF
jgi:hypothetical protein